MITHVRKFVTPDDAALMLIQNAKNRALSKHIVENYARMMTLGLWHENGDVIRFDTNGNLIDGQHRLHAVVKSGIPQYFIIVTGLGDEAFMTIDRGNLKRTGQILGMSGIKNGNLVAAIVNAVYSYEKTGKLSLASYQRPCVETIAEIVKNDESLLECGRFAASNKDNIKTAPSYVGFMRYVTIHNTHGVDKSNHFFDILKGVAAANRTNAAFQLRDALMSSSGKAYRQDVLIALMIKSWNLVANNKDVKQLKYDTERETYPKVDGYSGNLSTVIKPNGE